MHGQNHIKFKFRIFGCPVFGLQWETVDTAVTFLHTHTHTHTHTVKVHYRSEVK